MVTLKVLEIVYAVWAVAWIVLRLIKMKVANPTLSKVLNVVEFIGSAIMPGILVRIIPNKTGVGVKVVAPVVTPPVVPPAVT